jgi:hypothetical protein
MLQERITISLSGKAAEQFRELAKRECLPMTALAKQIILKYLTAQQAKEN